MRAALMTGSDTRPVLQYTEAVFNNIKTHIRSLIKECRFVPGFPGRYAGRYPFGFQWASQSFRIITAVTRAGRNVRVRHQREARHATGERKVWYAPSAAGEGKTGIRTTSMCSAYPDLLPLKNGSAMLCIVDPLLSHGAKEYSMPILSCCFY